MDRLIHLIEEPLPKETCDLISYRIKDAYGLRFKPHFSRIVRRGEDRAIYETLTTIEGHQIHEVLTGPDGLTESASVDGMIFKKYLHAEVYVIGKLLEVESKREEENGNGH